MLFTIDRNLKIATPVPPESFAGLAVKERFDLQEWVLSTPSLLGEELLVISSEFNRFDRTSERLDALMLDRHGKLVVVELKRTASGTAADLQALRYAAYCSTLSVDDIVDLYAGFHEKRQAQELSRDTARAAIQDFVIDPSFEELDDKPRIILGAEEFPPEMTATLLWLRTYELDISAIRLRPHRVGDQLVVESSVLIPLPEAEDFLIRRERKDVERTRARGRNEQYRGFFQELIDRLRETHHFTNARVALPQNWYSFASGLAGISYAAVFTKQGLRAELYIDLGNQDANKRVFDALKKDADTIQSHFEQPLSWERLDDRRASRLGIYSETTIDSPAQELEAARDWMIQELLRLKQVLGPRVEGLLEQQ